ncbi:MAG: acetate--CoA ligase family protein [Anaerolineaceae bacterium]|nr:acetate--CoA ligase family protein [Anaerolineaceae bacterium]
MDLNSFFYPKSVAIIGSMAQGKLGARLARQILDGGYSGTLAAVNPKAEGGEGISGYSSAAAVPQRPDLALIVSPAATVAAALDDCGKAGVRAAVIITSGFSEAGNSKGEEEILQTARKYGIRFIGPNCAGIASAGFDFFPTLELRVPAGGVGLISQSGALGGVVLGCAQQRELGISKFISYGNGCDLSQVDYLRYLAEDDETKVVAVYIESVTDGRAFMDALSECARRKPVLVIKAGRTSVGRRATASHTGSMAGSDAVYDAAIRASGAIRVRSVEALMDVCEGFSQTPPVGGKKLLIVTNSGGPGVLAADLAEELGLNVAEPSAELQTQLRTFLPGHCSLKNPIDLTVEGTEEGYRKTLQTLLGEYDAAVAINVGTSYLDNLALARGVVDSARTSGKPVMASFVPQQLMDESAAFMKQNGVVDFPSGERAVSVLAQMARYENNRSHASRHQLAQIKLESRALPEDGFMLEPQAMSWLKENGIPVPEFYQAASADEAVRACERLGYPVVMKVVSPDILHKSDVGGVVVGIRDAQAARKAFGAIQQSAQGKAFCGAVVYPMIKQAQEVLLGLSNDPQFGPVVAFGLGGIYTEIWRDIVLRVAPVDADEAMEMIHEIKAIKLLTGARGSAPCDLVSLAQTLSNFSRLPFVFPEISEVDLNPVFLMPKGLVVGDVRVIKKQGFVFQKSAA